MTATTTSPTAGRPEAPGTPGAPTTAPVGAVIGTVLPTRDPAPDQAAESRRLLSPRRASDGYALIGATGGAVAVTWVLFTQLAPFSGALGWVVVWYLAFITLYAALVSFDEDGQAVLDRVVSTVIHSFAAVLLIALGFVIFYVVVRGLPAMVHLNLYTKDLAVTGPLEPLTSGGVIHGIAGTLIQIGIALVLTVPIGLVCAVFLNEFPGRFARLVRTVVEAMTALPSVVAGLFIFSFWVLILGFPRGGLAASLALSVMMLPIIVRAADVVLRLVPGSLTEASLALGASRWRTVWHVTLPTARSGLATAVILGTARGIGETSPVLLTAGYGNSLNLDPREGPMVSLPLLAYELRRLPSDEMIARSFGAASILLVLVLVLFIVARTIGGRGPGVLTPRQQRARARQSLRDAERLAATARQRTVAVATAAPVPSAAAPSAADTSTTTAATPADEPDESDAPGAPGTGRPPTS